MNPCECDCECETEMYCAAHRQLCDPGTCAIPGTHECVHELVSAQKEDA